MDIIERSFGHLIGKPCWQVRWKRYLGVDLSFGTPLLRVREPEATTAKSPVVQRLFAHRRMSVKGEWWLWVQCGRWSLTLADDPRRITMANSVKAKEEALGWLEGQRLTGVAIDPVTAATTLIFDLGAEFRVRGSYCDDGEMYSLYKPNRHVLVVRSNGTYSHERSTSPERWKPLRAAI
jgi:hypothetical protein